MAITSTLLALLSCLFCAHAFTVLHGDQKLPMEDLKIENFDNLIDLALKTDETATIELTDREEQMIIAQHGSRIILDCSSLMSTGQPVSPSLEWREFLLSQGRNGQLVQDPRPMFFSSGFPDRVSVTGLFNRYLNISYANIIQRAETADSGVYVCSACSKNGCQSANVTIYMLGTRFDLVEGDENADPTSSRNVDRVYNIGTDFCVEEGSTETIQLRCDAEAEDSPLPVVFPPPSRTWTQNGTTVYSVPFTPISPLSFVNRDFFTNSVLRQDVTFPSALLLSNDGSLQMNFAANRLNFPQLAPDSTPETVQADVLEALLGTWTCSLSTVLETETATSVITKC